MEKDSREGDQKDKAGRQEQEHEPAHEHAWKGSWDRPVKVDEDSFDPLTIARMTDHNVRGENEEDARIEEAKDREATPSPRKDEESAA